jgi:serine/threonine-protein kinase
MLGVTLGNYRIEGELGAGGMGAVYVGTHALLGRRAAIKVLLAKYSQDQDIVQRFFNEARAATAIKHPGIVEIYDFGYAPEATDALTLSSRERTLPTNRAETLRRRVRVLADWWRGVRPIAFASGGGSRAAVLALQDLKGWVATRFATIDRKVRRPWRCSRHGMSVGGRGADARGVASTTGRASQPSRA